MEVSPLGYNAGTALNPKTSNDMQAKGCTVGVIQRQQQHLALIGVRWGFLSTLSHGLALFDLAQEGTSVDTPFCL